ncbi:helix-turn-helix domain-containing protein [Bacillus sp. FJAT-49736]|nr:helix-turn-helix domain-containing protein [Bacillus sp. FJAT-49736]
MHNFINRFRIERAAKLLRYQKSQTITEIALQCGFSSISIKFIFMIEN